MADGGFLIADCEMRIADLKIRPGPNTAPVSLPAVQSAIRNLQSAIGGGGARAVALLEVVLALAVFFGVAVAILGGLSVCLKSATQVREEAQAADLAVTVLSEVQMGILTVADAGPMPFEDPFADWTWQTVVTPVETTVVGLEMTQLEVIVKNVLDGYVYRLYQLLPVEEGATAAPAVAEATPVAGGPS